MSKILILIIKFYQYFISPVIGNNCRFLPTCSEYFIESIKNYGVVKGLGFGVRRILKCHPFKILGGGQGLDFVQVKIKKRGNKNG